MDQIENCWYRISVKAIIQNEYGEILLCKESNGSWDLPGGGLDHGEDVYTCLKREITEEMGLHISNIEHNPIYFLTAHKPQSSKRPWIANVCYKVEVENLDIISSDECIEIAFFSPESIGGIRALENVQELARQMII